MRIFYTDTDIDPRFRWGAFFRKLPLKTTPCVRRRRGILIALKLAFSLCVVQQSFSIFVANSKSFAYLSHRFACTQVGSIHTLGIHLHVHKCGVTMVSMQIACSVCLTSVICYFIWHMDKNAITPTHTQSIEQLCRILMWNSLLMHTRAHT